MSAILSGLGFPPHSAWGHRVVFMVGTNARAFYFPLDVLKRQQPRLRPARWSLNYSARAVTTSPAPLTGFLIQPVSHFHHTGAVSQISTRALPAVT